MALVAIRVWGQVAHVDVAASAAKWSCFEFSVCMHCDIRAFEVHFS
jgi:hypothetical protein